MPQYTITTTIRADEGCENYSLNLLSSLHPSEGGKLTFWTGDNQVTFNKEIFCFLSPSMSKLLKEMASDCFFCSQEQVFISLPFEITTKAIMSLSTVLENGVINNLSGSDVKELNDAIQVLGLNIIFEVEQQPVHFDSEILNNNSKSSSQHNQGNNSAIDLVDIKDFDVECVKHESFTEFTEISRDDIIYNHVRWSEAQSETENTAANMFHKYINSLNYHNFENYADIVDQTAAVNDNSDCDDYYLNSSEFLASNNTENINNIGSHSNDKGADNEDGVMEKCDVRIKKLNDTNSVKMINNVKVNRLKEIKRKLALLKGFESPARGGVTKQGRISRKYQDYLEKEKRMLQQKMPKNKKATKTKQKFQYKRNIKEVNSEDSDENVLLPENKKALQIKQKPQFKRKIKEFYVEDSDENKEYI